MAIFLFAQCKLFSQEFDVKFYGLDFKAVLDAIPEHFGMLVVTVA